MDPVAAALGGVGGLVLVAPLLRAAAAAGRAGLLGGRRAAGAAGAAAARVGARGAVGLGCAAAAAASVQPVAAAAPLPAPAAARPAPPAAPALAAASAAHAPAAQLYVVRPGDCLWSIAAAHLRPGATDAEVARAWPRWYRANRSTIGPDPSLLLVGTRLHVPASSTTGRRTGTSAQQHTPRPGRTPLAGPSPDHGRPGPASLDPDRR